MIKKMWYHDFNNARAGWTPAKVSCDINSWKGKRSSLQIFGTALGKAAYPTP